MPAVGISLVKASAPDGRDAMIQEVLKSVSVLARPGALPFVVSALAQAFPTNLEAILGTAIDLQPDLVLIYAQIATLRLPGRVEDISYVIGKKSPIYASDIAQTMAEVTPNLDAIVRGLKRGIPEYQPSVEDFRSGGTSGFIAIPTAHAPIPGSLPVGTNLPSAVDNSNASLVLPEK